MSEVKKNIPALRFPEFSGEWEKASLKDVTSYTKGFAFKSEDYQEEGIRIVRVSDLGADQIKYDNDKVFIASEKAIKYKKYNLNPGNIIITTVGSKPDMLESAVGRGIYILNGDEGLLNQNMLKFENLGNVSNKFLMGIINSARYQHYMKGIARGNANQANITVVDLLEFKISLPTLPEQQKIATFLSSVDKKIGQLTEKKELLEEYKKGVMQKIFSREIRFKKEDGSAFEEWEERKLGEVLTPTIREISKPDKNYLAIGVRSHCKGTFQKPESDPSKIAMDKLYVVKEGDLIVNITFAWEGAIAMVKKEDEGGLVSHRFPTYRFKQELLLGKFFQFVFVQKFFRFTLDLISPGGAGRNRVLSKSEFLKIKWQFPSIPEQEKIANFLTSLDDKIETVDKELKGVKEWKKGLLQKMFV